MSRTRVTRERHGDGEIAVARIVHEIEHALSREFRLVAESHFDLVRDGAFLLGVLSRERQVIGLAHIEI
jgi:hypothetical protein